MERTTSPERPTKRQRARKACLPCRKRKRKCDANYPCSMCTTYGYNCQYPPDEGPAAPFVDHPHHVEEGSRAHTEAAISPSRIRDKERSRSPEPVDRGILDPFKGRFMGLHSAVAFPRSLGLDLQSSNPPRIHSFGWNCGIRSEEPAPEHENLSSFISKEDAERYAAVYMEIVHPIFGIFDQGIFKRGSDNYFFNPTQVTDFNAVLAGVLALGSFFSTFQSHPNEHLLVAYAKAILEDPIYIRAPTQNLVTAHVLRTVYLRATTRPHVSWIASCTALHCAEACGLHREIDSGVVLTSDQESPNQKPVPAPIIENGFRKSWGFGRRRDGCEVTRRLFWSAWAMNRMISYEYGRSCVVLNGITTKLPKETDGDFTYWHIMLARLIPTTQPMYQLSGITPPVPGSTVDNLLRGLARLDEIPDSHPFLTLSKADLALCIYRRLRLLSPFSSSTSPASQNLTVRIITLGNAALKASEELAAQDRFWWQIMCTVFQYICVLLAIDNSRTLRELKPAMSTLDANSTKLGTHIAREAAKTARLLIRDATRKKQAELEILEEVVPPSERGGAGGDAGEGGVGSSGPETGASTGPGGAGNAGIVDGGWKGDAAQVSWNWDVGDVDWDVLLDPGLGFAPQDWGVY